MAEAADCADPFLQNMIVKPARQIKIEIQSSSGGGDCRKRGFNRLRVVVVEPCYGKNLLQGSGLLCPLVNDWAEFGEEVDELFDGYSYEWVLTAGHCVCVKKRNQMRFPEKLRVRIPKYKMWPSKKLQNFKPGWFQALRSGRFEDVMYGQDDIKKYVHVYASYTEDFNSMAGHDFALIQIPVFKSSLAPNNIQVWDTSKRPSGFSIVGFPAEADKQYLPYYDRRKQEFKDFEKNPKDTQLVQAFYTSDTSGGQSGGPIQFINADDNYSAIVGIHVTGKVVDDEEASACMLTTKIKKWVGSIQSKGVSYEQDSGPWLIKLCRPIRLGTANDQHHLHIQYLSVTGQDGEELTLKPFDASPLVKQRKQRPRSAYSYTKALIDDNQITHSDCGSHVTNHCGTEDHWMAFEVPISTLNKVSAVQIRNRGDRFDYRLQGAEVTIEDPNGVVQWKTIVDSVSKEYNWKVDP